MYQKMKTAWEEIRCEKLVVETNRPLKKCVQQALEHLVTNSRYNVVPGMKRRPIELEPLKAPTEPKYKMPKYPGPNMGPLFRKLKAVLVREEGQFAVESDRPDYYRLVSKKKRWKRGGSIYFAAVRRDLGAVYVCVKALEHAKRMRVPEEWTGQHEGGFCFRFERADAEDMRALERLMRTAVRWYRKKEWA